METIKFSTKTKKREKNQLLNLKAQRLRRPLSQSMNEQFVVHHEALDKHFLRTLFWIRVNERVLVVQLVPVINGHLVCTQNAVHQQTSKKSAIKKLINWKKKKSREGRKGFLITIGWVRKRIVGEGLGTRSCKDITRGEEGGVNGKGDFVVLVSEGWPRGPDQCQHQLLTRHRRVRILDNSRSWRHLVSVKLQSSNFI